MVHSSKAPVFLNWRLWFCVGNRFRLNLSEWWSTESNVVVLCFSRHHSHTLHRDTAAFPRLIAPSSASISHCQRVLCQRAVEILHVKMELWKSLDLYPISLSSDLCHAYNIPNIQDQMETTFSKQKSITPFSCIMSFGKFPQQPTLIPSSSTQGLCLKPNDQLVSDALCSFSGCTIGL